MLATLLAKEWATQIYVGLMTAYCFTQTCPEEIGTQQSYVECSILQSASQEAGGDPQDQPRN